MDIFQLRDYCLSLPLTEETTPFDEDTLVYKIGGKMYACASMNDFTSIGLKAKPDDVVELRERYTEIGKASHMSTVHWIGVNVKGDLPDCFIKELIRQSFDLVIAGMARAKRTEVLAAIEALEKGV